MSKSVIIKSNGIMELKSLDNLQDLQKTVGGNIEAIYCKDFGTGYINEEGKLENLPVNIIATMIWAKTNEWKEIHDVLVGDVIFTGEVDKEGNTKDISDKFIDLIGYISWFINNKQKS